MNQAATSRTKILISGHFGLFFCAQDELAVINSLCLSVPNKKSKVFLILILSALVYWQREIKLKTIFKNKIFFFS